jgi:carboxylesterase type B
MLWIHGGAFIQGSGASQDNGINIYDGTQLALKEVIVVTINYRLGIFGLLYANRSDCTGNMAFWDQALALKWTKHNIRSFGGNPNDITLFGQSAGSISISSLIISPITMNLFRKVIMQSGLLSRKKNIL